MLCLQIMLVTLHKWVYNWYWARQIYLVTLNTIFSVSIYVISVDNDIIVITKAIA